MFVSGFNIEVSFQSTIEEHYFDIKERDFVVQRMSSSTHGPMHSQVILSREDTNTVSLKTKSRKYAKFHAIEPSKHTLKKSPTKFHLKLHLIQPYLTYVKSFPVISILFALHNVAKQHSLLPLLYHTADATTYATY